MLLETIAAQLMFVGLRENSNKIGTIFLSNSNFSFVFAALFVAIRNFYRSITYFCIVTNIEFWRTQFGIRSLLSFLN